jgi:hypothetical protein
VIGLLASKMADGLQGASVLGGPYFAGTVGFMFGWVQVVWGVSVQLKQCTHVHWLM